MQLVSAYDDSTVVDAFVTGIADVQEIAPGVMRLSFYVEYEEDGQKCRKIVDHQLWSIVQLYEALANIQSIMRLLAGMAGKKQLVTYLEAPAVH